MPPVVTVGAYCEPKLHTLLVKKLQPLYLIAGIACTTRVMNTNPSISSGTTAPRSAPPSRRGGGVPAPPSGAVVAEVAMNSAADRADQGLGGRHHARRQRLEVDWTQVRRGRTRRERPVQECLQRRCRRGARLGLLHDHVLVVDDWIARGRGSVDQRLRPRCRSLGGEAGQCRVDGRRGW